MVMIVFAMIIMVVVIMVVVMVVTMRMIVRRVLRVIVGSVLMAVLVTTGVVAMLMPLAAAFVSAAFGIERRLDLDDARAQPLHHRLDHMIAADAQSPLRDLGRQVSVAEVPGEADQMLRVARPDFQERLGRRHHFDQPAIFELQCVAAAQGDRIFQIEQEFQPTRALHRHSPTVAIVKIEHDAIGRRLAPAMLSPHLYGPNHRKMSRDAFS
jgi:hypothetical protein